MLFFTALCINAFIFEASKSQYKLSYRDANFEVDLKDSK